MSRPSRKGTDAEIRITTEANRLVQKVLAPGIPSKILFVGALVQTEEGVKFAGYCDEVHLVEKYEIKKIFDLFTVITKTHFKRLERKENGSSTDG